MKPKYAELFPVVEVQQTFYQPPRKISTLEQWRASVPPDFEFTLKAWQLITHTAKSPTYKRLTAKLVPQELEQCGSFQNSAIVQEAWETTRACAKALVARHVLFQCPPTFAPTPQNLKQMRRFFSTIKRDKLNLLWEPRGNWAEDLILSLCRELNLIHAVDPFVNQTVTPEFIYFRLHGGKGFRHVFTDEELALLARQIPEGKPAYVMFNNMSMLNDARRFQNFVK